MLEFQSFRARLQNKKIYKKIIQVILGFLLAYFLVVYSFIIAKKADRYMIFAVIPCCLFVSIIKFNDPLILLGELFTLISDIFLILFDQIEMGMFIFWLAHVAYGAYFYLRDKNKLRRNILLAARVLLIAVLLVAAKLFTKDKFNSVVIFSMIYYANLIINLLHSIILKDWLLVIAFMLFTLCDTTLGLINILPSDNPFRIFLDSNNFVHLFYMPSQVLIVFNRNNNNYADLIKSYKANKHTNNNI